MSDAVNVTPKPTVYPVCKFIPKGGVIPCGWPYVLRRILVLSGGGFTPEWLWQADCKHKSGPAEPVLDETPTDALTPEGSTP